MEEMLQSMSFWVSCKEHNATTCCVQLTLVDINAPAADNALYNPETLSLDALALTAITRFRQEQKPIGPVDFDIIFDDPLGAGMCVWSTDHAS